MAKKRLLIKGNIQDVGYRVFVKFNARKLGIRGLVRNLPDDTVEIFCDKDEATLDNFIKAIDVKAQNGQTDAAHVDNIEVYDETDHRYSEGKSPSSFDKFDVDYGQGLHPSERENMHRQEILVFHGSSLRTETRSGFKDLGEKVDTVGTKVECVGQDVRAMNTDLTESSKGLGYKVEGVGEKVHAMHTDMIVLFDALDGKYHTIGDSIIETNRNIERMNENNARVNDNNTRLIENNSKMTDNLKTLTDALKSIVEDYIAEKRKETGKAR